MTELNKVGGRLGRQAARLLAGYGVCAMAPGLTDAEFDRVESAFGVTFADDHRAFLAAGLPLDPPGTAMRWPNWRHGDPGHLRNLLDRPAEGVLFDVEAGDFWSGTWGPRPPSRADAVTAARTHLERAPAMIPVHSHRYLPAGRGEWGHPVLSMHQTDIIVYGSDLLCYLRNEFRPGERADEGRAVTVPFWRDLVT